MNYQYFARFTGRKQGAFKGEPSERPATAKRSDDRWIELAAFEMKSEARRYPHSLKPTSARAHPPLVITMESGGASPQLLQAHWMAEVLSEVVIERAKAEFFGV